MVQRHFDNLWRPNSLLKAIGSINRERLAVSMVSRAGTQLRQRARQIDLHCKSRKTVRFHELRPASAFGGSLHFD